MPILDSVRERIRAKVRSVRESTGLDAEDRSAVEQGLLPLFDDWAFHYYLREDGGVLTLDALAPDEGLQEMPDGSQRLAIHRIAVEEDPELAELIPPRPADQTDCTECLGTGRKRIITVEGVVSSTICLHCHGTGWVAAGKAAV